MRWKLRAFRRQGIFRQRASAVFFFSHQDVTDNCPTGWRALGARAGQREGKGEGARPAKAPIYTGWLCYSERAVHGNEGRRWPNFRRAMLPFWVGGAATPRPFTCRAGDGDGRRAM